MGDDKHTGGIPSGRTGDALHSDSLARNFFTQDSDYDSTVLDIEGFAPRSSEFQEAPDYFDFAELVPVKSNAQIRDLGDDEYFLKEVLLITIEEYPGEDDVIASVPELEIFGHGMTESEAIASLKFEILDLFEELSEDDMENLGDKPRAWLRILNRLIGTVSI